MNSQNSDFDDLDEIERHYWRGGAWVTVKSPKGDVNQVKRYHPIFLQLLAAGWQVVEDDDDTEQSAREQNGSES